MQTLAHKQTGKVYDLLELASKYRDAIAGDLGSIVSEASSGELAALISYAIAFPERFTALVDTYDVKRYLHLFTIIWFLILSAFSKYNFVIFLEELFLFFPFLFFFLFYVH